MENKDYISNDGIRITTHKDNFDLDKYGNVFVKWVKDFKKNVLDVDFKGDKVIGEIDITDNKISFLTTIKWGLEIERIDGYVPEEDEEDTKGNE